MINLSVRLSDLIPQSTAAVAQSKALSVSSQSFADQLSEAFSATLSKLGIDPSSVKLTVDSSSSQANVTRQNPVVAESNTTAQMVATGFSALVPVATNGGVAPSPTPTPPAVPLSADETYWSKQPAEVQQLSKIDDQSQRSMLAAQLAAEGYSIDVPVMVWGWDPGKVTQLRQSFGYQWTPSAFQSPVSAAPGISGGAILPYDPAHPPAGSIIV